MIVVVIVIVIAIVVTMNSVIMMLVVQSEFQFVFPWVKSFSNSESDDKIAVVFGSITFL